MRLTGTDPCQFHKLLSVSEGSVNQDTKGSIRWIYVLVWRRSECLIVDRCVQAV